MEKLAKNVSQVFNLILILLTAMHYLTTANKLIMQDSVKPVLNLLN